jgi:hypothetical protein
VEIKIVREQKMRNGNDETAEIVLDDAMYKTACINLPRLVLPTKDFSEELYRA